MELDTAADEERGNTSRMGQLDAAGDSCSWQPICYLLDPSGRPTERHQWRRPTILRAWRFGQNNLWRRSTRADGADAIRQSLRRQRLGRAELWLWRQQRPDIPRRNAAIWHDAV